MKEQLLTNNGEIVANQEAEKFLLSALMIDSEAYERIESLVTKETFSNTQYSEVYECIQNLIVENKPIDIITLSDAWEKLNNNHEISESCIKFPQQKSYYV
jgi:replicative DNA helicase